MSTYLLIGISESEFQAELGHHEAIKREAARLGPIRVASTQPVNQHRLMSIHGLGTLTAMSRAMSHLFRHPSPTET